MSIIDGWRTWPNAITAFRIVGVPILILLLIDKMPLIIVMSVYCALVASDFFDGWLARRTHSTSEAGEFLDQLADKIFVLPLLWYLFQKGIITPGPLYFIVPREILVVGFRIVGIFMGIRTPSLYLGKLKATFEYITIGFLLAGFASLGTIMIWLVVVLAVVSFFQYSYYWGYYMMNAQKLPKTR